MQSNKVSIFLTFLNTERPDSVTAALAEGKDTLLVDGSPFAMIAPAIYIAITTCHQDFLPTQLLLSLMFHREGVPFPAFVEAVLMEITIEIIRKAGIQMPRNIGQPVSIVGTIVVGQAAVDAGFVTAAKSMVVAIIGISSFVIPAAYIMSIAFRIRRFLFMGVAACIKVSLLWLSPLSLSFQSQDYYWQFC